MKILIWKTEYQVTLDCSDVRLSVMVEEKYDIHSWRADFTSKYVEEITQKSRSPMDFTSFVILFDEALKLKQTDSRRKDIYLDLLSSSDLELLRGGAPS